MPRKGYAWVFTPGSGGKPVPKHQQEEVRQRIIARIAATCPPESYERIDVRFRGKFCYIDAYTPPPKKTAKELKINGETREDFEARWRSHPMYLCRLLHYSMDKWGCAFFTYSNEKYEICAMANGKFDGPLEEGVDIGATYLH